jgi:hypothetical protein
MHYRAFAGVCDIISVHHFSPSFAAWIVSWVFQFTISS